MHKLSFFDHSAHLVLDGNDACPGLPQTFASLAVQVTVFLDTMASTLASSLGTAVKEAIDGQVCAK